jgi:hypothetical protein
MRVAIRNKAKIVAHFYPYGEEEFERIRRSAIRGIVGSGNIEELPTYNPNSKPYPTVSVSDIQSDGRIEFYIIGQQYDVYTLAFKGFIE